MAVRTLADQLAAAGLSPSLPGDDFTSRGYNVNYGASGVDPTLMSTPSSYVADPMQARYVGEGGVYDPYGAANRPTAPYSAPTYALNMVDGKNQTRAPGAGSPGGAGLAGSVQMPAGVRPASVGPAPVNGLSLPTLADLPMTAPGELPVYPANGPSPHLLNTGWSALAPEALAYTGNEPNYVGKEVPVPGAAGAINAATTLPSTVPFPWPDSLNGPSAAAAPPLPPNYGKIYQSGGETYIVDKNGRLALTGRAPGSETPSLMNSIVQMMGNGMGVNASLMNGQDMAESMQRGFVPIPTAPTRQYNPDTNSWETANMPILNRQPAPQRVIPQARIDGVKALIANQPLAQGASPTRLNELARGIAGADNLGAAIRLNNRAVTEEGYGQKGQTPASRTKAEQLVAQTTNISRHDNPKAYAAALAAAQAQLAAKKK